MTRSTYNLLNDRFRPKRTLAKPFAHQPYRPAVVIFVTGFL